MTTQVQYLLLALILASVQISYTESLLNEKPRDKTDRKSHRGSHLKDNICEITDREAMVHCYCESLEAKTATRADCWVFNGGIKETDPLWATFNLQPHLEKLSFTVRSEGALTFIPLHVIHRLKRLQKLSINYAILPKIEKRTFANMTNIKDISLTNDKIAELDFSAFANLPLLVNLTIKENKITELQRDVFVDLPSLRYLDISSNNINVVHDGCFEHLNVLNDLVLQTNAISILTRDTFRGLGNLTRLDMRANKLSMIGDLTFTELWNLNELLLDNNELKYLSERAFDGLSQLQKLSMTGNKLQSINEALLEGVRGLQLLDLRNNELEYFTFETIKPILENLKMKTSVLYLSGNKLICDCRLLWIQTLKNETKSEPLRLALDDVTCLPVLSTNDIESTRNSYKEGSIVPSSKESESDNNEYIQKVDANDNTQENSAAEGFELNDRNDEEVYEEISALHKNSPTAEPRIGDVVQNFVTTMTAEDLPCEIISNDEDSLMLSSKDEPYWKTNKGFKHNSIVSFIFTVTLVKMLIL